MAPEPDMCRENTMMSLEEMKETLRLKRFQLDKEIEDFKRLKEVEFQRYEEEVKKEAGLDIEGKVNHSKNTNDASHAMILWHMSSESGGGVKAREVSLTESLHGPTVSATQSSNDSTNICEETTYSPRSALSGTITPLIQSDAAGHAGEAKGGWEELAAPTDEKSSDLLSVSGGEDTRNIPTLSELARVADNDPHKSPNGAGVAVEGSSDLSQGSIGEGIKSSLSEMPGQGNLQSEDAGVQDSPCCMNGDETEQALVPSRKAERPQPETQSSIQDPQLPVRASENDRPAASKEDRELEFRSLFTPAFLPLLEEPSHRHLLRERNGRTKGSSKHGRNVSDTPKLSSSLTTLPLLPRSNESTISTSQPRLGLGERRSSSSPTGTGRTLRSSLRSPDAANRERKHVLFSIDNRVISPSTSPTATRSIHRKPHKATRTPQPPIPISGLRDFPFREIGAPKPVSVPARPSNILLKEISGAMSPSMSSPTSPHARSYKDLVEPTVLTPPDEVDQKDLAMEESNPMFDDQRGDDDALGHDEDFWSVGGRHGENFTQQNEENDVLAYEQLTGSGRDIARGRTAAYEDTDADMAASPHASSLPIAIKGPSSRPY